MENPTTEIDLKLDEKNLYREESFTDMKTGAIRRMTPVLENGDLDTSRPSVFIGSTQLVTPEGPLPIQAMLTATNIEEALIAFPIAMKESMDKTLEQIQMMRQQQQQQQQQQQPEASRIIMPGK